MSLNPGMKLGPYEIVGAMGAGGMGEVYRARDPRVGRDVAIKIASSSFTERFEREGRAVAALNHANICQLYDVGAVPSGPGYLVMELVEGPTLAEVMAEKGALPLDEALDVAQQIAAALEAAHDKGIIHRDLKPANIKVTPSGVVKVLDFGLAKLSDPSDPSGVALENSPTMTLGGMTQAGVILGTAAYMAPEQARGKAVDKRADIWAFGVIVHEMITGDRLFAGDTVADTLIEVATKNVAWDRVPPRLEPLLRKCLERDPRKRLRDIGDLALLLEGTPATAPAAPIAPVRPSFLSGQRAWAGWGAAAIATIAAAALAVIHFREQPPEVDVVRLRIPPPEKTVFDNAVLLSPDGRKLAFTTTSGNDQIPPQIWVRALDTLDARPIATWSGNPVPFWSPDSRFIAYQQEGKLKKVDIAGGPPVTLCDAPSAFGGGAWSGDIIVFGDRAGPLHRVPASGGVPAALTVLDPARDELSHGLPSFLPDGRHFFYLRRSNDPAKTGVYLGSIDVAPDKQELRLLVASPYAGVYVPASPGQGPASGDGFLLFGRETTLLAQPFDTKKLALVGEPVPVAEGVSGTSYGFGRFSASAAGALAYRSGGGSANSVLRWYDRQGKALGTVGQPAKYNWIALSPDAGRVAAGIYSADGISDLWLVESDPGGRSERFTFDPGSDSAPVWSPDGRSIVFSSSRRGAYNLYRKPSNPAAKEEELFISNEPKVATDWPRDDTIIFASIGAKTRIDVWSLLLTGGPKASEFVHTDFVESDGRLSPDGRWLLFAANYSGRMEVYVRSYPPSAERTDQVLVSNGGGAVPDWRADGKELFYLGPPPVRKVMAVSVTPGAVFTRGAPAPLFDVPLLASTPLDGRAWDATADGSRFLFNTAGGESSPEPITLVLNWAAALRR